MIATTVEPQRRRRETSVEAVRDRCRRLRERRIEFVRLPDFGAPDPESRIESLRPDDLAPLASRELLTADEERYLFSRMNWLKFEADRLRKRITCRRPDRQLVGRIERLLDEAVGLRNRIACANLRLAFSIASRFVTPLCSLDEAKSEAVLPVLAAIEKFDVARGYRFSTYATHAIRNHLQRHARRLARRNRQSKTFVEASEDERGVDPRPTARELERVARRRHRIVECLLDRLSERDRRILTARFGLGDDDRPRNYREIGQSLGLSKERVRVLTHRALERLHEWLGSEMDDLA